MSTPEDTLAYHVTCLGDDVVDAHGKLEALEALEIAGLAAVPLLIERLAHEDEQFLDDREVATGPMNPGPPARVPTTVQLEIEALLYRIISPPPEPPAPAGSMAAQLDQAYRPRTAPFVDNWPAWWAAHHSETLEQIRAWSREQIARIRPMPIDVPGAMQQPRVPVLPARPASERATPEQRRAYAQTRDLVERARRDPTLRAATREELTKIGRDARLAPHVQYALAILER